LFGPKPGKSGVDGVSNWPRAIVGTIASRTAKQTAPKLETDVFDPAKFEPAELDPGKLDPAELDPVKFAASIQRV
jgi:hypothetical protein